MANVSLTHIYKVYPNGAKAVNDFNMDIADKEFIVFVGPSGCGKSTTLRMIAGLEEITIGELRIGDELANDMTPQDRNIAMVFQNYALYPNMTAYENMAFGLRQHKVPKDEIEERIKAAAESLDITELLQRKPKEMSGGQRQRVALGRAIVRDPRVMLLDEPLSNLDAKLRTQMRSEITKLHLKLNTTFIYVTHDQIEAMTMGTRIVVMKDGYIRQIDTPRNLYNYPCDKFVAGFIGTPQMNFFEGTLKRNGETVEIAFANSEAKLTVPYSVCYKTPHKYLRGDVPVIIGLRSEDLSLDPEVVRGSSTTIKVKISHTEQLGNEALIYGDINMSGDGFTESNTRVIIKGKEDIEVTANEVLEVALNVGKLHLFDKETEVSILPRVPENNYIDCNVRENRLTFLGQSIPLPPAMHGGDGADELQIPADAIMLDGGISVRVDAVEIEGEKYLLTLNLMGRKLHAVTECAVEEGSIIGIGIDLKKVALFKEGVEILEPLARTVQLGGGIKKVSVVEENEKHGKATRKKVKRDMLVIEDTLLKPTDDITRKLFKGLSVSDSFISRLKVYKTQLTFECTPYDFIIGGDNGVTAQVTDIQDYGTEQFARCKVGEKIVLVKVDAPISGEIKLMPMLDKLSIIQSSNNVRIV